jgi:hypothetical protein
MAFNVEKFRNHISKYNEFSKSDKFEVEIPLPSVLAQNYATLGQFGDIVKYQCEVAELPGRTINTVDFVHHGFTERRPHFTSYDPITLTFYCNGELAEKKFFDAWLDSIISYKTGMVQYSSEYMVPKIKVKQYSQFQSYQELAKYATSSYTDENGLETVSVVAPRLGPSIGQRVLDEAYSIAKDVGKSAVESVIGKPFGAVENMIKSIPGLGDILPGDLEARPYLEDVKYRKIYVCSLFDAYPVAVSALPLSWADDSIQRVQVTFVYKKWESSLGNIARIDTEGVNRPSGDPSEVGFKDWALGKVGDWASSKTSTKLKKIVLGKLN